MYVEAGLREVMNLVSLPHEEEKTRLSLILLILVSWGPVASGLFVYGHVSGSNHGLAIVYTHLRPHLLRCAVKQSRAVIVLAVVPTEALLAAW